ncbi:IclR family transcriptional regulator C-terminal domain-containing protein [Micromonospora sp. KC213]|uniref:IclR family transcriptional regulator domain-containing protein n=1 Tax=Micromonospora sp. KC213 TaxID=2530378 RepID=UPI001053AC1B|nr:IclR family transcriptional regulator C-terminal domain-containing protein [Micromonospora sp. KC213]TDC40299.1 IclR family transcriptional regulator [Micromonospora sp. KC213]
MPTVTDPPPPQPPEVVTPLIRGIALLRAIAASGGRRSVSDLVRVTGLARSTVDRVLSTVTALGYLQIEDRDAVFTPRLMELGNAYLAASRLPDLLGPLADHLADALDESVSIAVPDADGVRFVHQATRRRAMSLTFRIGDLLPAERVAAGAIFAAGWNADDWQRWRHRYETDAGGTGFAPLPYAPGDNPSTFERRAAAAREHGWALDDQLIEPGLIALAMPVPDVRTGSVCAVSVVSHTSRHSTASLRKDVLPQLRETVATMKRALAGSVPPARPRANARPGARSAASRHSPKQELGRHFVESFARGLAVVTAFDETLTEPTLTDVAEATGLARATARRALITLEHEGYAASSGRHYRLTPRVLELGFAQLSTVALPAIAQPHLVSLAGQVHESASMAILSGDDIQYVARVPTVRIMSVTITTGTRFPAYATSMGRVLLAGLPPAERATRLARMRLEPLTRHTVTDPKRLSAILDQTALNGYALVDEELEEGLRSIAVPIHDRTGQVVAAINVSTHAGRGTTDQARAEFLPKLRTATARIEQDLRVAGRYVRIQPV